MSGSKRYADRYGRVLAGQQVMAAERRGAVASIVGFGIVGVLTCALAVCSFVMLADTASASELAAAVVDPTHSALAMAGIVVACAALVLAMRRLAAARFAPARNKACR